MDGLLERAAERQIIAQLILGELDLVQRWSQYGQTAVIGAVAYGLVVAPDIDMEIFCRELNIEDGFEILRLCALHPNVTRIRFWNALGPPHFGLYWQVRYSYDDLEWKIDMWSMEDTYDGPCGTRMVDAMKKALTPEKRQSILKLKEEALLDEGVKIPSIQIYRAVIEDGVSEYQALKTWEKDNQLSGVVTDWLPGKSTQDCMKEIV